MLVNIATGSEYHKQSILKRQGILRSVLRSMNHESPAIRVASIWVIINLTWPDDKVSRSVHECVTLLRSMGFEDRLLALDTTDHDPDVNNRVKTALQHFLMDQQQYGHNNNGNGVSSDQTGSGNGRHGHSSSRYHDPQQQQQDISPSSSSSSGDAFGGGAGSTMDTTHIVTGGSGAGGHDRR